MGGTAARLLTALVVMVGACMHPADERARYDFEEVGHASAQGVTIAADPGVVLTASATPPRFTVRASAPHLVIDVDGTGTAEIVVTNLTADAEVSGAGVTAVSSPAPLSRRVEVELPARIDLAPADNSALRPVRFAYTSDFHINTGAMTALVAAVNADPTIEMVMCGGDIIDKGSELDQWERLAPILAELAVPFYTTVGNHELNGDGGVEYHRRLGRMSYTFDYHGVRVAFADSGSATMAPRVFDYLDDTLAATGAAVRLLVTHTPLFDSSGIRNGGFSSRLEAERILAMLVRNEVDLLLYGHVHSFEAFQNARIPAYIANGGGGQDNAFDGIGDHYLAIDIDPVSRRATVALVITGPE